MQLLVAADSRNSRSSAEPVLAEPDFGFVCAAGPDLAEGIDEHAATAVADQQEHH